MKRFLFLLVGILFSLMFFSCRPMASPGAGAESANVTAEKGRIDLFDITPATVDAGANITFAVFFTNNQGAAWLKGNYAVYIEIFDEQKNLFAISGRIAGETDIAPQQKGSIIVAYPISAFWGGNYFAKAKLSLNMEDIAQSDVRPFIVNPKITIEPQTETRKEKIELSGNINLSFTSSLTDTSSGNYPLNISAIKGDRFLMGISGNLTVKKNNLPVFQNYLISLMNRSTSAQIGFFYPYYSELSLGGLRAEGVELGFKSKSADIRVLNGISQRRDIQHGFFKRSIKGARAQFESGDKVFNLGFNYLSAHDNNDPSSLSATLNKPIDNEVFSVNLNASLINKTALNFEYSKSNYDNDTTDMLSGISDDAYKIRLSRAGERFSYDVNMYGTGLDFYSVGAFPSKDQRGLDFGASYRISRPISFTASIKRYRNNVAGNPLQKTLTNLNQSYGFNFIEIKGLPDFSLGFTSSDGKGRETTAAIVDYMNTGVNFSTNKEIGSALLNLSFQKNDYKNRADSLLNSNNSSLLINVSSRLSKSISLNAGSNSSRNKYQTGASDVRSLFYNAGLSFQPAESRFSFSFNQNWNSTFQQISTKVFSSNLHVSWDIRPNKWKVNVDLNESRSVTPSYLTRSSILINELQHNISEKMLLSLLWKRSNEFPIPATEQTVTTLRLLWRF